MKLMHKTVLVTFVLFLLLSCTSSKRASKQTSVATTDTTKKAGKDTSKLIKPKPYSEVITARAFSKRGLFTVHKIDDRYYFEIPDSLLNQDILLVSRISKGAASVRNSFGMGYSGDEINENEIIFSKGPNYKLYVKRMTYSERSSDSSENGMYRTVQESNLQPILAGFDIKAFSPDSTASVIDVTDFLTSDNSLLYFAPFVKKSFNLGGLQKDKSYIKGIESFPINVELQTVTTYSINEEPVTFELNTSFVLLPRQPMQPRTYDNRVGYFSEDYMDYDALEGVAIRSMINRWRLEPKDEDKEKYLRGELVEPKKPIVFYVDPETPKKWVPYLIQAVNDWQKAFEKAGFKNAIYASEAPINDSTFNLYDARHNAIIYKASPIENASGPRVADPRTGEILETHINWYHNVQKLLHDWYMVQAGPNDPKATNMIFDDCLMGRLIRFVACHEVGHTLGLKHNFGASSTVPVDSLRSKAYLTKYGLCPSIMDYARFNYVAQPEDSLPEEELFNRIGVYDEWAIEWGYRWLPQLKTQEQEKAYMNQWIISRLKDKKLWYGPQDMIGVSDPRRQSEDLGDDAMKAGTYGIQNLKRVMKHIRDWTIEPNADYGDLAEIYQEVIAQYQRYLMHVANYIGNIYRTEKKAGQDGPVLAFVPKELQKRAVQFISQELFETPGWLNDPKIFALIAGKGPYLPLGLQTEMINWIVTHDTYNGLLFFQAQDSKHAYTYDELLSDLEEGIWKELKSGAPIDLYRSNLQNAYAERLIQSGVPREGNGQDMRVMWKLRTDHFSVYQTHMRKIVADITRALTYYKDAETRAHLVAVKTRLSQALQYNHVLFEKAPVVAVNNPNPTSFGIETNTKKANIEGLQFNWLDSDQHSINHFKCSMIDAIPDRQP